MKIITPADIAAHRNATITGGLQGAGIAAAIAVPGFYYLQRRSATFRSLPIPMKAFMGVTIVVPFVSIMAEKAGERFDRSQWTGVGAQELVREAEEEKERRESLDRWDALKDWGKRNKWSIVGCSWAGAMVGSFALVSRNKYQSFPQKLVQARVYAQALTVGLMLAVGAMSGISTKDEEDVVQLSNTDHSWKAILEQEGFSLKDGEDVKVSKTASQHSPVESAQAQH